MNVTELNKHLEDWTGDKFVMNESAVIWAASQDGGAIIEYFTNLLAKMKESESHSRQRMTSVIGEP